PAGHLRRRRARASAGLAPARAVRRRRARRGLAVAPPMTAALKRRLYRGGRPGRLMRVWNRVDTVLYRLPLLRRSAAAVLTVRGRGGLRRVWTRGDTGLYRLPRRRRPAAAVPAGRGRRSGRLVQVPVAVAGVAGVAPLVSMLGPGAGWVRNVEAAGGRARLHWRGRERDVLLAPVPVEDRPPVLRRYLAVAPGARPH